MNGNEAFRIARKTLAEHFQLQLVGSSMQARDDDPEAAEAAAAYNWLADNHPREDRR